MLQQLRREQSQRRVVPATTTRAHLQRERTQETSQGVLVGKRMTPRVEASTKPFVTRETTITPMNTQTAAPAGTTLEWKVNLKIENEMNLFRLCNLVASYNARPNIYMYLIL